MTVKAVHDLEYDMSESPQWYTARIIDGSNIYVSLKSNADVNA